MIAPHLAAALDRFSARMAASASLPAEQITWKRTRPIKPAKPGTRSTRPPPRPSRQYARAISTELVRDQRLTQGARNLGVLLRACCGRDGDGRSTRPYLAAQLGVTVRSVARWLAELRSFGYVVADRATDHTGRTAGLYVIILDPMLPSWERGEGDSAVSPLRAKIKDSREDAFASWWRLWPAELGPTRCDSRRAKGVAATWAGQ
jgi:hypothetical protein